MDSPTGSRRDELSPQARALCEWLGTRGWDFRAAAEERGIQPAALYRQWLESLGWNQSMAARIYRKPGTNEAITRQAIEAQMKTFGVVRPPDLKRVLAGQDIEGGLSALREVHALIESESSLERLCCEQLLALAKTYQQLRDHDRARTTLLAVVTLALRAGTPELLARAVLPFTYSAFQTKRAGTFDCDTVEQLDEWIPALRSYGELKPLALALAHLGLELYWSPRSADRERGLQASKEALALAERSGDPALPPHVKCFRLLSISGPDQLHERLELLAPHLGEVADLEPDLRYVLLYGTLNDQVEAARFKEAAAIIAELRVLEKDCVVPWPERHRAVLATAYGEWEEAERLCTLRPGVPRESAVQIIGLIQFETLLLRGRWEDLESIARWNANMKPELIGYQIALARVLSLIGRGEEMRGDFERWTENDCAQVPRDFVYIASLSLLAEICHELEDTKNAQPLYDLLAPYRDRMIVIRSLANVRGPVAHRLACLATTLGKYEQARIDFDSAQKTARAAGTRPFLAWVEYDYARMLVREGKTSSQDRIRGLASSASTEARGVGMDWLASRADAIAAAMVD